MSVLVCYKSERSYVRIKCYFITCTKEEQIDFWLLDFYWFHWFLVSEISLFPFGNFSNCRSWLLQIEDSIFSRNTFSFGRWSVTICCHLCSSSWLCVLFDRQYTLDIFCKSFYRNPYRIKNVKHNSTLSFLKKIVLFKCVVPIFNFNSQRTVVAINISVCL